VVALGLGGAEEGYPSEQFAPWFERARAAGLHSTPHAGEGAGPESIWGAVRALGAERIGHGVRAIEDPTLVAYLAEQGIALEVCPTSNVRLGIYRDYADHPLARLHAACVPITVNSDDPCLFGTTLTDEVALLDTRCWLGCGWDRRDPAQWRPSQLSTCRTEAHAGSGVARRNGWAAQLPRDWQRRLWP